MPVLFVFLLKVNIALLLFCAGYYLVLRHLTFYTLNRVYLLAAIVFASVYPLIDFSAFLQRHEALAKPVQQVVFNWQAVPVQNIVKPLSEPNYWHWAEAIFWIGALLLTIRLAVQLYSLFRLYKRSQPATINNHKVRVMDKDAAPFSFWQSIFVNPANHEPADLNAILLHEQVHVNQWHTADILLAELSSIFYWFNPGIWLMKKAIRENIEFITDHKILNKGIDSKAYQYSLVSVSFNNTQPSIVNHFNISTIKKRIIMMNAKRSSKIKLTRYAFLVPGVMALLLVFSVSKADFVKKSSTYKSLTLISKNVGNAVGINNITTSIKAILPAGIVKNDDAAALTTAEVDGSFADAEWYVDGEKMASKGPNISDDTESINYLSAAEARKYFNAGDGKHKVAFATRKNTAQGAALRAKLAQLLAAGKIKSNAVAKEAIDRVNAKVSAINKKISDSEPKTDTVKKVMIAETALVAGKDSMVIYVNGKKNDAKNIKPTDISSMYILNANDAEPFIHEKLADNIKVAIIITKDSPEGKALKEKLDTRPQNLAIAPVAIKAYLIDKRSSTNATQTGEFVNVSDSAWSSIPALKGKVTGIHVTSNPNVVVVKGYKSTSVTSSNSNLTPVVVQGYRSAIATSGSQNKIIVVDNGTASGTGNTKNKVMLNSVNGIYVYSDSSEVAPAVFINGKESTMTELKKLDPNIIKSVDVRKSENTDKKGKTTKSNSIYITTKKN